MDRWQFARLAAAAGIVAAVKRMRVQDHAFRDKDP